MKSLFGFFLFVLAPSAAVAGFAFYVFVGFMNLASENDRAQARFMNTCVSTQERLYGESHDFRIKAGYSEKCFREWRGK